MRVSQWVFDFCWRYVLTGYFEGIWVDLYEHVVKDGMFRAYSNMQCYILHSLFYVYTFIIVCKWPHNSEYVDKLTAQVCIWNSSRITHYRADNFLNIIIWYRECNSEHHITTSLTWCFINGVFLHRILCTLQTNQN